MRWICALNLCFLAGFGAWLAMADEDISLFSSQFDFRLHLLQMVGFLGILGALVSINYCLRSWTDAALWYWTKLWNTALMLACLGYVFFLLNWHMLNFRLNY